MPDIKVREKIFRLNIGENLNISDENFKLLAQLTVGFKLILNFIYITK